MVCFPHSLETRGFLRPQRNGPTQTFDKGATLVVIVKFIPTCSPPIGVNVLILRPLGSTKKNRVRVTATLTGLAVDSESTYPSRGTWDGVRWLPCSRRRTASPFPPPAMLFASFSIRSFRLHNDSFPRCVGATDERCHRCKRTTTPVNTNCVSVKLCPQHAMGMCCSTS